MIEVSLGFFSTLHSASGGCAKQPGTGLQELVVREAGEGVVSGRRAALELSLIGKRAAKRQALRLRFRK